MADWGSWLSLAGAGVGAAVGGPTGGAFGAQLGGLAGSALDGSVSPKTGAEMGLEAQQYWKNAYPGITPWEAAGSSSGSPATGAGAAERNKSREIDLQDRALNQQREMKQQEIATQMHIADRNNVVKILDAYRDDPSKAREMLSFYDSERREDLSSDRGHFDIAQEQLGLNARETYARIQRMSVENLGTMARAGLDSILTELAPRETASREMSSEAARDTAEGGTPWRSANRMFDWIWDTIPEDQRRSLQELVEPYQGRHFSDEDMDEAGRIVAEAIKANNNISQALRDGLDYLGRIADGFSVGGINAPQNETVGGEMP